MMGWNFLGKREGRSVANEALMCAVLNALADGRAQPLLDAVHEDVSWTMSVAQKGFFPFGGTYSGKAGVEQVLAGLSKRYRFRRFEPQELVSCEEIVWGLFDVQMEHVEEHQPPPRTFTTEMAIRWRVRDKRILEHHTFVDTLSFFFASNPAAAMAAS